MENEIREAFTMNCQSDNRLALNGLGNVLRSVGLSPTEMQLRKIAGEYEQRSMKTLDVTEVLKIVAKYGFQPEATEDLREALRIFDKDGNGYINVGEFRHVLVSLGEKLADEEVDELMRELNMTGDGQFSYDDLINVIKSLN
ncbi:calmodulin-like isoform X2 [Gigantopelta aegis]|nr:calmodulin-like isoform X2 [Gigantopelta aegis]